MNTMKIYILIIILIIIIVISNLLLQKKIEKFNNDLPEYIQDQNENIQQIQNETNNNATEIADAIRISTEAKLETIDALNQLNESSSNTAEQVLEIEQRHQQINEQQQVLEEQINQQNRITNRKKNIENHTIIFYEHHNKKGKQKKYLLNCETNRFIYVNLCPKRGRKRRCNKKYNDKWSSVKIPPYTTLTVYDYDTYKSKSSCYTRSKGGCRTITNNKSYHRVYNFNKLNDRITSFKARKTQNNILQPTNNFCR
jgi:predicted RND superfamily exporter protein